MQKSLRAYNLKFWTGQENYEENNSIPEDKFYSTRNTRFSTKTVTSKKGFQALGPLATGGTSVEGIYSYPRFSSTTLATTNKLIRFYNSSFAIFDESTQTYTAVATVWPSVADSYTDSVVYNNIIYFVNPMTANVAGVGKIEDSTFSVIASSPRGNGIESWVERLWVIGDAQAPNAVTSTRAASFASPTNIEDWVTSVVQELIGKGGINTAIRKLNSDLYIFKADSIWYNTPARFADGITQFIELSRTTGAINQKSTIVVENDVWFLTPNLEVRSLGSERNFTQDPRTKNLTEIIKRTMNLLDPIQDNPVMSYFNRQVRIHLKTIGSATNNITLVFDYNTGGWAVDRGQSVNTNVVWGSSLVYGEDGSGQIFVDETGYSFNGSQWPFDADTRFMDDGRPDTFKRARYIYFRGQQSYYQPITIRLYRDSYTSYSEYVIPSPYTRGVSIGSSITNDGQQGSAQWGAAIWGGSSGTNTDIAMYRTEKLISVNRRSNMYALGLHADIDAGKIICEQLLLKVIDENENYKRSDY